jgi:hypothetical protein
MLVMRGSTASTPYVKPKAAVEAPKRARVTVPERCHPVAKIVFEQMREQMVTYDELEHRSGVLKSTFKAWRTNNRPGFETLEACLGALGWGLLPVPRIENLPPEIRSGLEALAERWGEVSPLLCQLMASVARSPIAMASTPPPQKKRPRLKLIHPAQTKLFEDAA